MKVYPLFMVVLLAGILLPNMASAYRPGHDIIRECPKCKTQLVQQTTMSGNTFGARFWTDGKMEASMLPFLPWLVKCPKCGTLIWIDEVKELGKVSPWEKTKRWPDAKKYSLPNESEIINLAASGKLTQKKELYARRTAWYTANDAVRMKENAKIDFSEVQRKNMEAMAELLDEKQPGQRLMKAEIYRELGAFKDCIKLLEEPFKNDYHKKAAAFIRELAKQKIKAVREIKRDKRPAGTKPGNKSKPKAD